MGRYTTSAAVIANFLPAIDLTGLPAAFRAAIATQLDNVYIPMAEDFLDDAFGQTLAETTRTDVCLDGADTLDMCLPNFPIKTVTSARIVSGFETPEVTFQNIKHLASNLLGLSQDAASATADLVVDRDGGMIHIDVTGSSLTAAMSTGGYPPWPGNFPRAIRNIKVSYIHGFPAGSIPIDIQNAAGMFAASFVAAMSASRMTAGANRVRIGSVDKSFGDQLGAKAYPMMDAVWQKLIDKAISNWSVKPLAN
jgi:hypothetical protein